MSVEVSNVEPKEIWKNFVLLNEVPRPSKKEEKVIDFLKLFASKNNLEFRQDEIGNLVIAKESTEGMSNRETVVLQSHVDMVHEKNNDVDFDFLNSKYHNAKAAPRDPPASPAAGCIHILSKIFSLSIFPLATQFNATPPAKHKFLIPYSFLMDFAKLIIISSVTF